MDKRGYENKITKLELELKNLRDTIDSKILNKGNTIHLNGDSNTYNSQAVSSVNNIIDCSPSDQILKESEQKFRTIIETAKEGFCLVDRLGNIKDVNSAYCDLIGYSREELLKMSVNDVEVLRNKSENEKLLTELITSKVNHFETVHRRKDGSLVNLEVSASHLPLLDNLYVAFMHDITQRKREQKAGELYATTLSKLNMFAIELSKLSLDDDLEKFIGKKIKELSCAMGGIFTDYDYETRTTSTRYIEAEAWQINKIVSLLGDLIQNVHLVVSDEIYHVITTEVIGIRRTLFESCFGAVSRPVCAAIQSLFNIDRFIGVAYIIEGKLYGTSLLAMSAQQPDPPRELLENFVHLAAESLRRKKTQIALLASETKLKSLVSNIPGAVYHRRLKSPKLVEEITSYEKIIPDFRSLLHIMKEITIEYFNERVEEITGYSSNEFVEQKLKFGDLMHPDEIARTSANLLLAVSSNKEFELEYRIKHKNGSWRWILERGNSYFESQTNSLVLNGIIFDISDRKNIELELENYAFVNQELKQFAYTASHQLQEPMRTVSNFTRVIEEDYSEKLGEDARRYLQTIRDATKRMTVLIDSLMEYSQLGRNTKLLNTDCNKLVESVISDLEYMFTESGADIDVARMPVMNLYEVEIRQLFKNLISNAIKFRMKGRKLKIKIRSEKQGDKWKFSVKDNGIGIAPVHYERIFNIFQRLHINEDEYEGKGIGLAYCKKIVELHHGEIWVESKPGVGSTFFFTIPAL